MRRETRLAAVAALLIAWAALGQEKPRPLHYRIEVAGSFLKWELPSTLETVKGDVGVFRGDIIASPLPSGSWDVQSRIVVPAAAMHTGNRRRDSRMRGKILETARYPEIVFELTRFTGDLSRLHPGQNFSVQVAGKLTVHGRAANVQLPVDVFVFEDRVEIAGSFPLNWKDFAMADPSIGVNRVKEPMLVTFRFRAIPTPEARGYLSRFATYNRRFR